MAEETKKPDDAANTGRDVEEQDDTAQGSDGQEAGVQAGDSLEDEDAPDSDQDGAGDEDADEDEDDATSAGTGAGAHSSATGQSRGPLAMIVPVLALVAGAAIGYVGHDVSRKQKIEAAKDACDDWQRKVCSELGEKAAGCTEAKAAVNLMPASACFAGLEDIQTTIKKAHEARAVCDDLVKRLCDEVGPGTDTCKMVTEQTAGFPAAQCEMMQEQFDQVLARVRMIAAQQARAGGMPPGNGPVRMPGGHSPSQAPPSPPAQQTSPATPAPSTPGGPSVP